MSYLVLARKWRPRRFAELVGQAHVVRALTNALQAGRVHHAFLFTGTRGVGKTTIARIFAKSLNCETGIGAEPCGECAICTAVDAGRFVDLIEIDAASNTGVDDVRELIDNAQYMPSRGRYKVYLIDEVHMLSRNAFNALLKTLEEPPEHVKFLLATTDPQKLPVTVLSRCLQFNLKRLSPEQIGGQIESILVAEDIAFDAAAVAQLAQAADGSLRDGLSLLDQAIAYGAGSVREADVLAMLGSVDSASVDRLVEALIAADGAALLAEVARLAEFGPDFGGLLEAIAAQLHRIQLAQLVPALPTDEGSRAQASRVAAEVVQLWYQMALAGQRELPLAPTPRTGFEMTVLRMLAFRPLDGAGAQVDPQPASRVRAPAMPAALLAPPSAGDAPARRISEAPVRAAIPNAAPQSAAPTASARVAAPAISPEPVTRVASVAPDSAAAWIALVGRLPLGGPARELAARAAFLRCSDGELQLGLSDAHDYLRTPSCVQQLGDAVRALLDEPLQISFHAEPDGSDSFHAHQARQQDARQVEAERVFAADPSVRRLLECYDGRIVPGSVRPLDTPGAAN